MTKLSVNINKLATLRNARGENNPDLVKMALLIEAFGADGITVHPRSDERHIRKADVLMLREQVRTELNVEGYPSKEFIDFMFCVRPHQITLVPDPPDVLTSNAGFNLLDDLSFVKDVVAKLKPLGTRISLFIDPSDFIDRDITVISATQADRIELYTKNYADNDHDISVLELYRDFGSRVKKLGLGINAGHDLSLNNLKKFLTALPFVDEVSIGHALICDALIMGMSETVRRYKSIAQGV